MRRVSDGKEVLRDEEVLRGGIINTYLTDVGGGWEGELLSVDVEGQIRHLADAVTVDNVLRAEGERQTLTDSKSTKIEFYCSTFNTVLYTRTLFLLYYLV